MKIADFWNSLANPKQIPKLFAIILAIVLIVGFTIPFALNVDQIYPRPAPQEQINAGDRVAPYDRGGEVLVSPGITDAQYPNNSKALGWINSYMSPIAIAVKDSSPYFGTSIYSSPGGLIDEILYYTRGFDTILESTILMMSFIIASWLFINFTANTKAINSYSNNINKNNKISKSKINRINKKASNNIGKNTNNSNNDEKDYDANTHNNSNKGDN